MKDLVGKEVKVVGDHYHKGETGTVNKFDHPKGCEKAGIEIETDKVSFYVFDREDVEIVNPKEETLK